MAHQVWFTSDTHLGHDRIIRYCNRPFTSAIEMEEVMLERFNSRIRRGDTLYHLGDVAWSTYELSRFFDHLNAKQVHLILGNHDGLKLEIYKKYFVWIGDLKKITIGSVPLFLFHYPVRSWLNKGHGAIHLYGHVHGTLPPHDRSLDVGVDPNNFYPISFDEVYERTKNVPMFAPTDTEAHNRQRGDSTNGDQPTTADRSIDGDLEGGEGHGCK